MYVDMCVCMYVCIHLLLKSFGKEKEEKECGAN